VRIFLTLVVFLYSSIALAAPRASKTDRVIICPIEKVQGCDVTVDPLGNPSAPVKCAFSHCRVGQPRIIDGRKVCSFTCPDYFVD
jgi:hypothetical protein